MPSIVPFHRKIKIQDIRGRLTALFNRLEEVKTDLEWKAKDFNALSEEVKEVTEAIRQELLEIEDYYQDDKK